LDERTNQTARTSHGRFKLSLRVNSALGQGKQMDLSRFPGGSGSSAGHAGSDAATEPHATVEETDESGFTSIGLPPEAGWYVSATLYWLAGLTIVLIQQFSAGTITPVIGVLGVMALAASPLLLLGARFAPDAAWGAPVRILFPAIVFLIGGFIIGDAIVVLVLLPLLPVLAVAYMHRPSLAVPYCAFTLAAMAAMLLVHDTSGPGVARAITLTAVSATLVAGLVITQFRLRRAAADNHNRSVTDPLTGIANLRGLRARLQQELQRSTRDESEIVMFAIDLDDFKEVNDQFSYALGDAVLQAVAQTLAEEIEPGDLLARRGGDEFAILTIATPGRHMARFGDRIAASIARTRRAICPAVNPRASVTRVAHLPGESAEAFLRRVDDGLHAAKLDAHPERAGQEAIPTGEQPEIELEEHNSRALAGARRAQLVGAGAAQSRSGQEARLEWRMCAYTAIIAASVILLVVIPGLLPGASSAAMAACAVGLLALGAGSFAAGEHAPRKNLLHVPVSLILALSIAAIALGGTDRYAIAELAVLSAPLAIGLFGWRRTVPYAIVASGALAYFIISSDRPFAVLHTALLIGILGVLTLLLQRGEQLAEEYSATAAAMSVVDPLTGAANLRGFDQRVKQEIARCAAVGDDVCLTMIDLERFKAVNDRYSHSMGDALLIETARAIESVVREDELVVRRGGDEFAIVSAPELGVDMDALAGRIAEAIVSARARLTPDIVAGATVVNVFHDEGESAEHFMRRADEALRTAKLRDREPVGRGR
jgi:diguanylate cyclase (GGDEF)-like protein